MLFQPSEPTAFFIIIFFWRERILMPSRCINGGAAVCENANAARFCNKDGQSKKRPI